MRHLPGESPMLSFAAIVRGGPGPDASPADVAAAAAAPVPTDLTREEKEEEEAWDDDTVLVTPADLGPFAGAADPGSDTSFTTAQLDDWHILRSKPTAAGRAADPSQAPAPPSLPVPPPLPALLSLPVPPTPSVPREFSATSTRLSDLAVALASLPTEPDPSTTTTTYTTIDLGGRLLSEPLPDDVLAIPHSRLTLRNGTLRLTGAQGVAVSGTNVRFECVDLVSTPAAGKEAVLSVRGAAASLLLHRCTLAGSQSPSERGLVCAAEGSSLVLEDCTLEGAISGTACSVVSASQLTARRTSFVGCGRLLAVRGGSLADATACKFVGCADKWAGAVSVGEAGSRLRAGSCTWSGNTGVGLRVLQGGSATLDACELAGSLTASGLLVEGCSAAATATHSRFVDNFSSGVKVAAGGTASLSDCDMTDNKGWGLIAAGGGTKVEARECRMVDNRQNGAQAAEGASASLHGCRLASAASSYAGLRVRDKGTTAVARHCRLVGGAGCGVKVSGGGSALVQRCVVTGNRGGAGAVVDEGSRLEALMCELGSAKFTASGGGLLVVPC